MDRGVVRIESPVRTALMAHLPEKWNDVRPVQHRDGWLHGPPASTVELLDALPDFSRLLVDQPMARVFDPHQLGVRNRFRQPRGKARLLEGIPATPQNERPVWKVPELVGDGLGGITLSSRAQARSAGVESLP